MYIAPIYEQWYTFIMKKNIKTNAMRILDKAQIQYQVHTYEHEEGIAIDGTHVANMLNKDASIVFKTLLTQAPSKQYYVFVIPVHHVLDFKKCASTVHEKSITMIPVKDINKVSGYIRGGCSPIGMKKQFPTIFDSSCLQYNTILFSGGKIGFQIETNPNSILSLLQATCADISNVA